MARLATGVRIRSWSSWKNSRSREPRRRGTRRGAPKPRGPRPPIHRPLALGQRPSSGCPRGGVVTGVSTPPAGLIALGGRPRWRDYLKMLWARREFTRSLASGQLRTQNMDTVLGNLWQLINPILLIGVYYLVFGVLLDIGDAELPWRPGNYIGFLSVGVFIYSYQQ